MNLSFLALFFVGIITIYAIAFTLIIKLLGRKFKDKSNMYFLYASVILVIQSYLLIKDFSENQSIRSVNILFFLMAFMLIFQGLKRKKSIK
ncbi:phosphoglycerol transferase MdoB-like AlkP superfamily enzyme [Paenibacillus sp. PvP094]